MTLSAVLNPEADGFVSLCPELDIASQGDTIEEALTNLKEALEGFFETASAEEIRTLTLVSNASELGCFQSRSDFTAVAMDLSPWNYGQ